MSLPTRVSRTDQYFDPLEVAHKQFDNMLGRLFNNGREMESGWAPYGVDVREDGDHIYVEAELPGFRKEDVDITLENNTLTFTAQRQEQTKETNGKKGEWLLRERRYSRVQRSFTLPPTVNEQSVQANLADGVLTITLNKREETKPRKITVA
ncbi:MAG: Hsp20/alpha crystallin family protein [Tepidisphaeraceae bacterium]|jgi:HSP20 family protein